MKYRGYIATQGETSIFCVLLFLVMTSLMLLLLVTMSLLCIQYY